MQKQPKWDEGSVKSFIVISVISDLNTVLFVQGDTRSS